MFPRRFDPVPVAVVAAATGVGLVVRALAARRRALLADHPAVVFLDRGRGCTPDTSPYVDSLLTVHGITGEHLGPALALLREENTEPETPVAPLRLDYDDALRSCVEVGLTLALQTAHDETDDPCDCGDDACDGGILTLEWVALVAGQILSRHASSWQQACDEHNLVCRACRRAEGHAPRALRARFCRDLADHLLLRPASPDVRLRGTPVNAALDVVGALMANIEHVAGVSVADQIDRLGGVLAANLSQQTPSD